MPALVSLACPLANGCHISPGSGARFGNPAALGGGVHTGLDLSAPIGTPVMAPAPGILRRHWFELFGGYQAELQHDGFTTFYAHLNGAPSKADGAALPLGAIFARSGASGQVTGAHLHFEVHDAQGRAIDPEPLLTGASSANVEPIPNPGDPFGPYTAYPRGAGKSCPAGYSAGTVNAGLLAGVPFNLWFNRPTNPDGTIDACIATGLKPGDNAATAQAGTAAAALAGQAFSAVLGAAIPVLVNVGVAVLVVVLAFEGTRQALTSATA